MTPRSCAPPAKGCVGVGHIGEHSPSCPIAIPTMSRIGEGAFQRESQQATEEVALQRLAGCLPRQEKLVLLRRRSIGKAATESAPRIAIEQMDMREEQPSPHGQKST